MAALFGIRALLTARLVMRTLIAQPGEPHRLLLEPTNGGNREKCILRAAITYFGVSPAHVFHVLARRKCAQQYAAQSAPPPAFFPCNLCPAYLWPDICLPAAIYGGRDNSNKGAATQHLDGCLALAARSSDIFRQSKTFQRFPPAGGKSFHVAPLQKMQKFFVRKWEIVQRGRLLFSGHRWDSSRLNAAVAAAFRQKDKFLRVFDGTVDVVSNDYAHETWIDDRHPVGDPSNN